MLEQAELLNVSKSCIGHALKRLGVTYKKNPSTSQSKAKPEERQRFQEQIKVYQDANKSLIYIDESGFAQDLIP